MKVSRLPTISPQIPISQRITLSPGSPAPNDPANSVPSGSSMGDRTGRSFLPGKPEPHSLPNQPRPAALDRAPSAPTQQEPSRNSRPPQELFPESAGGSTNGVGMNSLTPQQRRQVQQLKRVDAKVRAHEQAHLRAAGPHAQGGPQFEFVRGPNGRRYAVAGEVSLDTSPEDTPEETIRKMERVRVAALAPSQPSPQDRNVASQASSRLNRARQKQQQQQKQGEGPGARAERKGNQHEPPTDRPESTEDDPGRPGIMDRVGAFESIDVPSEEFRDPPRTHASPGPAEGLERASDMGIEVDGDVSGLIQQALDRESPKGSQQTTSGRLEQRFRTGLNTTAGEFTGRRLDLRI